MKIKEMTATFGKLDKATLKLGDGLNILEAPNEGGKSTWSAFLRAMFYGIPTGQRDKAGFLAEKNRYQPWSGAPMEGVMRVEWQGREIILRRRAKGVNPFGGFEAVDAATGEAIPELTAETAGELLLGAEREVYERSAFVGQSALTVDGAPALEKRIAGLLTAGQEEVSFSQVERQLKDWQNRRKHNKTGLIPKLEGEIEAETETLARFARARTQREEGLAHLDALTAQKAELEGQKAAWKAQTEAQKWTQYNAAYEAYRQAKREYDEAAILFEHLPSQDKLLGGQSDLQYLQTLDGSLRIKQSELDRARQEGPVPSEPPARSPSLLAPILAAVGAAVLLFSLLFYVVKWNNYGLVGLISVALGLLAGVMTGLAGRTSQSRAAKNTAQFHWEERMTALRRDMDALQTEREERFTQLLAFVHTFAPTASNEFGISAALARALQGEDKLAALTARLEAARKVAEMAKAALGSNPQAPQTSAVPPTMPYQEVVARLAALTEELSRRERMVAAAEGELRSLGDPDEAEARLEAKKEELERRREEYDALTLALDTLTAANQAMQARFSPALNRRAGQLLSTLTGGAYHALTLTRTFEALAQASGEVLPRSVLALSQGTADQLYLAVRLAVCDLTLPAAAPPPLVLDDTLANFDNGRMALALEHLAQRAETQQILLFTCHSREGDYLRRRPEVSITQISG